jgi:hypothetical protein
MKEFKNGDSLQFRRWNLLSLAEGEGEIGWLSPFLNSFILPQPARVQLLT